FNILAPNRLKTSWDKTKYMEEVVELGV
ncbi:hypothetical protein LCGC14_1576230, partial [marine sediment metagenome]